MKALVAVCIGLLLIGVGVAPAAAQDGQPVQTKVQHRPARAGALGLLLRPAVKEDLKLTSDQISKMEKALESKKTGEGFRFGPGEIETFEAQLVGYLTASQKARLNQLVLQSDGLMLLAETKWAKALGLTEKQKAEVEKISNGFDFDNQKLYQNSDDRRTISQKSRELRERANARIEKILTPAQKAKWAKIVGPSLKF